MMFDVLNPKHCAYTITTPAHSAYIQCNDLHNCDWEYTVYLPKCLYITHLKILTYLKYYTPHDTEYTLILLHLYNPSSDEVHTMCKM